MSFYSTILFSLFLLSLVIHPSFSQDTCKSHIFSSNKTFENCNALPTLNAILHWSYNPSNSSLSMAFSASPSEPEGWVAWALNPNNTGMAGSQALIAHKPNASGPIVVDTYDVQSYQNIHKGPISYNVSSISAEDSSGMITIFATWTIPEGKSTVNQVWQVGPMRNGSPGKHAFDAANLNSNLKLTLVPAGAPAGAPAASPGSAAMASSAPSPASGNNSGGGGDRLAISGGLALGAIVIASFFLV